MNARLAIFVVTAALVSSPVMAQVHSSAPAKPSLMDRMKAVAHSKTTTTTKVTTHAVTPMNAPKKGQVPRTAKSLDCSKQADAKNIHGKDRKSFMSHCKKA